MKMKKNCGGCKDVDVVQSVFKDTNIIFHAKRLL